MLITGNVYNGFYLKEKTEITETDSTLYYFEHQKTKAELVYLSNVDENKVFSIAFKTPVSDSTGVAHIIEHSVLNGSRKYPLKEPFVELLKGSLKTFLNAMTYPDKTIYPIASINEKDFMNLMDVYLDAVFYPRIYENEFVFMQEGWHYHLEKESDPLAYNGVVYNEMKGAYSNPDEILIDSILETLYSDTSYKYSSGGKPEDIIKLSYKAFIDFHEKYYHPSNSVIYLYGNCNINNCLAYLNEEYLSKFDYKKIPDNIPVQNKIKTGKEIIKYYPITEEEESKGKEIYNLSYSIGNAKEPKLKMSFQILEKLLVHYPSSPIRIAFNNAKIGKEIDGFYETDLYYYTLMLIGRDLKENTQNKFYELIEDTLEDLVTNGIDKDLIDAALNMYEFTIKDIDNSTLPKGLLYNIDILDALIYGYNPKTHIAYKQNLDEIKQAAHNEYFENLIKKHILKNEHKTAIVLKPKKGIAEEKDKLVRKSLKEKKDKFNDREINCIIDKTKELIKIQNTPDSKENLSKIPVLPISEIKYPEKKILQKNDNIFLYNDNTQGIIYLNVYYDISEVDISKYHYINLLSACLTETATTNYTFDQLSNAIKINTGGLDFNVTISKNLKTNKAYPQLVISMRFLYEKRDKAMDLLDEIITKSILTDKKRIFEIIAKEAAREKNKIIYNARGVLINRLNSYLNSAGALSEYLHGLDYYDFIEDLYINFEKKYNTVITEMLKLYKYIFLNCKVELLLTLEEKYNESIVNLTKNFFKKYENNNPAKDIYLSFEAKNEALIMSTDVNYVGRAYDYLKAGFSYNGFMLVLKTILQTDYLWNNVRVRGGAYGAFFVVERSGNMIISSYRDPHILRTYEVFDDIDHYLKQVDLDRETINKFIIGTIAALDMPVPPLALAKREYTAYKSDVTYDERMKIRDNILSTTENDIRNFVDMFHKMKSEQSYLCTIASKTAIEKNKDLYKNFRYLIK
jgi:hypothetical protein